MIGKADEVWALCKRADNLFVLKRLTDFEIADKIAQAGSLDARYLANTAGAALKQIDADTYREILETCETVAEYRQLYGESYNNEVVEDIVKRINNGELDGEIDAELVEEVLSGVKKGSNVTSLIDIDAIRPLLKTEPNTAFFWSGKTEGVGGAEVAAKIAKERGGVTLESMIETKNISMPEWDFNNPSTMEAWDLASGAYAEQVSGEVRAVIGASLREGNIWENVELPRLKSNSNVTKITTIDPKTGVETVIFER